MKESGTKHDTGKPRVDLIPKAAMDGMGHAYGFGANKYGEYNYKGGLKQTRLAASIIRHVYEFLNGSDKDVESGLHPIDHALAAAGMLKDMVIRRPDLDDRYKENKPKGLECIAGVCDPALCKCKDKK